MKTLALLLILMFVHAHFWFAWALLRKRNDVADVAWGLGFVLIATSLWLLGMLAPAGLFSGAVIGALGSRQHLATLLVVLWGLRLAWFISQRSRGTTEDPRYASMRKNWGAHWRRNTYIYVFGMQTFLLALISLPIVAVFQIPAQLAWGEGWMDFAALFLAISGLAIEALADQQKLKFKALPENQGRITNVGLWAKSRHPNYFGEMLFWLGFTGLTLVDFSHWWWVWLSPLLLIFLLIKVSGVALTEKRYAGNLDYQEHKKHTRLLWPF